MTTIRPIFLSKALDPHEQKAPGISCLSKKDLEEIHATSTHYPLRDNVEARLRTLSAQDSKESIHKFSARAVSENASSPDRRSSVENITGRNTSESEGDKEEDSSISNKEDHRLHTAFSSLVESMLPLVTDTPISSDDVSALTDSSAISNSMGMEQVADTTITASDLKASQVAITPLSERETSSVDHSDLNDFDSSQEESAHDAVNKMEERGGGQNSILAAKSQRSSFEVASVNGSQGSLETHQPSHVAAALRITNLLDELTATVSQLRLGNSSGKEMTIQLRPDILADTNIHIVSTGKQMEVAFLTSSATSNLLLNAHLATLQNHLNVLCPSQTVTVQTQLTSSSTGSHLGNEQDPSHDDLASFDHGNRGNFSNNDDTL